MSEEYYYVGLIALVPLIFLIVWKINKIRGKKVVPYAVGNKTIYIQRSEITHFSSRSKEDQRKFINRFYAQVKAGKFLPVYKRGKVIGYIKNKAWKKN